MIIDNQTLCPAWADVDFERRGVRKNYRRPQLTSQRHRHTTIESRAYTNGPSRARLETPNRQSQSSYEVEKADEAGGSSKV